MRELVHDRAAAGGSPEHAQSGRSAAAKCAPGDAGRDAVSAGRGRAWSR
jgi:hypothetical protein